MCVNTQTNIVSLVCLYLTSSLNKRWLSFLAIDMSCHLMNGITSLENDVMDQIHPLAQHYDRLVYCYCFLHDLYKVPATMRLCNSCLPEEHFVCYQTSQRNWVIIKVLYRCFRRYMLGWHNSRLGFVTLIIGEVSLGPLGNAHHKKPCKESD